MLSPRLRQALATAPAFDPQLSWEELVQALEALLAEALPAEAHERLLAYLELNLPQAEVRELIEWPGEWFGNRWYEEAELSGDQLAHHALSRSARSFPDQPELDLDELPGPG